MRIGQAIDEIFADRRKEFTSEELVLFWNYLSCQICIRDNETNNKISDTVLINDHFNREWELVQKPVSFMEAVESRKPFRVENCAISLSGFYEGYMNLHHFLVEIRKIASGDVRKILTEGKFYIWKAD